MIPIVEDEKVQLYQADPVSGAPVSEVKEVVKVKKERSRRGKTSGPNNSIVNDG